jgi:ABC-type Co2+ transport system permease subunit
MMIADLYPAITVVVVLGVLLASGIPKGESALRDTFGGAVLVAFAFVLQALFQPSATSPWHVLTMSDRAGAVEIVLAAIGYAAFIRGLFGAVRWGMTRSRYLRSSKSPNDID